MTRDGGPFSNLVRSGSQALAPMTMMTSIDYFVHQILSTGLMSLHYIAHLARSMYL